jgi:hypothetical protein
MLLDFHSPLLRSLPTGEGRSYYGFSCFSRPCQQGRGRGRGLLLFLLLALSSFAQTPRETNLGATLSMEAEKDLSRFFSLIVEEEVRFIDNNVAFDRSVTSLGIDYALFDRKVKIGVYGAFLYLYNNDHLFEPRLRHYLNLSYRETFEPFILLWRGRLQGTYRNENRDEYKINPKYVMKNKMEVAYLIWGSPWKPYFSCDFSTSLNDPVKGYELMRMRFQAGTNWRLDRTTYLDFFLRFDKYLADDDPHALSLGATYKVKF